MTAGSPDCGRSPDASIVLPVDPLQPLDPDAVFGAARPLEVDVGCGKGRFLLARAQSRPDTSFLGIDRMLRRIRKTARKVERAGLTNVRLIRLEASYVVARLLPSRRVRAYYVFFPDPWPKRRHHKRRLFVPEFVEALHRTLAPGGLVHIATDHADYFAQIRALFERDARFAEEPPFEPDAAGRTEFDLVFLRRRVAVHRCSFSARDAPPATRSCGAGAG